MASASYDLEKRTSSWPVRSQRRHEAITAFNTQVLASLSHILERIQSMDERLNELHHSGSSEKNICTRDSEQSQEETYIPGKMDELETRVHRMEILLFRTSLADFQALDASIESLLPKLQTRAQKEPELELTPDKSTDPIGDSQGNSEDDDVSSEASTLLEHAIYDLTRDDDSTSILDEAFIEINSFREQAWELRKHYDQARQMSANKHFLDDTALKWYKEFKSIAKDKMQIYFIRSMAEPKTTLSRDDIDKQYTSLHKRGLWCELCVEFANNTRDPVSKSDTFIRLAFEVDQLWQEGASFHSR